MKQSCLCDHTVLVCGNLVSAFMAAFCVVLISASATSAQETDKPFVYAGNVVFDGRPVEGAEVYVISEYKRMDIHDKTELMDRTDSDGTFRFSYQPDDDWVVGELVARCPGYSIGAVNLWKIDDTDDLIITLYRPSSVSGSVHTLDGDPLEDAVVYLYGYEIEKTRFVFTADMPGLSVMTGKDGRFLFDSIPAGSRASFIAEKKGFVRDGPIKSADAGSDGVLIILAPAGSISGRITVAETGEPVVGITVYTNPYSGDTPPARTDEQGIYKISNVRAGSYRIITASDDQYLGLCPKPSESVDVSVGEIKENVDIEWVRGVIVSGMVSDMETGEPLAGCSVTIATVEYNPINYCYAKTDIEGKFHATALPGSVYVTASLDGFSRLGTEENRPLRIVTADGIDEDVHLRLTKRPVVTGTVFLPDGSPARGARVEGSMPYMDITDKAGHFTVEVHQPHNAYPIQAYIQDQKLVGEVLVNTALDEPVEIHLHRIQEGHLMRNIIIGIISMVVVLMVASIYIFRGSAILHKHNVHGHIR